MPYARSAGQVCCPTRHILVLLAVGLCFVGCRKPAPPPSRPAPPVTVAKTIARDVPLYIDEIGLCTGWEVVAVAPQASGQITGIFFQDGAYVKKDAPLFEIDPRPYQQSLSQAQAGLAQAEAQVILAKQELARSQGLLPLKAVSQEDVETKQNALSVSQAQTQASQAAVETAKINLEYTFIRSPIDGIVGLRQVDIGNVVFANSGAVLVSIQRTDPIYADFTVTEAELLRVREKLSTGVPRTFVRLPDDPLEKACQGELIFLDNSIQNQTGTVRLRTVLKNADGHFWPGRFVKVRLVLQTLKDAVLMPDHAMQISQSGTFVYVVKPDGTAEFRPVKLGQRQGELVVVAEGLKAGETVIASGQLTVTPGQKVNVLRTEELPGTTTRATTSAASGPTSRRSPGVPTRTMARK